MKMYTCYFTLFSCYSYFSQAHLVYNLPCQSVIVSTSNFEPDKWTLPQNQVAYVPPADFKSVGPLLQRQASLSSLGLHLNLHPRNATESLAFAEVVQKYLYPSKSISTDRQIQVSLHYPTEVSEADLRRLAVHFPVDRPAFVYNGAKSTSVKAIYGYKGMGMVQDVNQTEYRRYPLKTIVRNLGRAMIYGVSIGIDPDMNEPIAKFKEGRDGTIKFSSGCSVRILRELGAYFNFTIGAVRAMSYHEPELDRDDDHPDGEGYKLLSGEADVSIYLAYVTSQRLEYLQPLVPICEDKMQIYFRQPSASSVKSLFWNPFRPEVWKAILWTIGFVIVLHKLFDLLISHCVQRYSKHPYALSHELKLVSGDSSCASELPLPLTDLVLGHVGVLCQLGLNPMDSFKWPHRILFYTALLFSGMLFAIYCGRLVAVFAVEDTLIKTPDDVVANGFTILAEPEIHYSNRLFADGSSDEQIRTRLSKNFVNDLDSVRKIFAKRSKYAYLATVDVVTPLARDLNKTDVDICNTLTGLTFQESKFFCGFNVLKGSPLKELFNVRLLAMKQRGYLYKHLDNLYRITKLRCMAKPPSVPKIELRDTLTLLIVLAYGALFSVIVLMVEKCHVALNVN